MRQRALIDTQEIASRLERGDASRIDLVALLIYVRGELPKDILRDIADCVAHDERDRGMAYEHIDAFVSHFVAIAERGGVLEVGVLFPLDELIKVLAEDLNRVGVAIDLLRLRQHCAQLEQLLMQILDGVRIKLLDPRCAKCEFRMGRVDQRELLGFTVQFKDDVGGILRVPAGLEMIFPVLRG